MKYCKKCGNRLDDFDGYCSNCGAKVDDTSYTAENFQKNDDREQVKRTSIEDAINNVTDLAKENFESFICLLLGIFSLTIGTFICGIVSIVFYKRAQQKGQTNDEKCALYCKIGKICSIVSIVLTAVGIVLSVICWVVVPLILSTSI